MSIDFGMIIQMRLSEAWGSESEMEVRNRLCHALEAGFHARELGHFDGTDVGGRCTNLFIYAIPPDRWEEALALAVAELTGRGMTQGVRIIRSLNDTTEDEDALPEHEVLWPEGSSQEWSIFSWID